MLFLFGGFQATRVLAIYLLDGRDSVISKNIELLFVLHFHNSVMIPPQTTSVLWSCEQKVGTLRFVAVPYWSHLVSSPATHKRKLLAKEIDRCLIKEETKLQSLTSLLKIN